MDLAQLAVPEEAELGVLLPQLAELAHGGVGIQAGLQPELIAEDGLQDRGGGGALGPQAVPGEGLAEAGDGADGARRGGVHRLELAAGVEANLVDLLLPGLAVPLPPEDRPDPELAAGDLQEGLAGALGVPGDLIDPGGEIRGVVGLLRELVQAGEELPDALQLQGGAEVAGEELALADEAAEGGEGNFAGGEILLQGVLVPLGGPLGELGVRHIHAAVGELGTELAQQDLPPQGVEVHFIEEEEGGYPVPGEELPEGAAVALDAVRPADDEDGAVQHGKDPLRLGGEVHMAGGVQQLDPRVPGGEGGLLRIDGDAPLPLLDVGIQEGVPVVHPAQLADGAALVEQGLGEGGLASVHVGQDAQDQLFHGGSSYGEIHIELSIAEKREEGKREAGWEEIGREWGGGKVFLKKVWGALHGNARKRRGREGVV